MHSHPKISNRSFRVQLSLFFLMSTIIRVAGSKKFHGSCKRQQASLRIVGQHISLKDHTGSEQIYQLDHAIDAVKNRHVSVRRAEEQYGIPKSTIHDHVSGRVSKGAKKGNPKYLTDDDEAMLVSFVEKCASIGYPRTRQQVLTHRQIDRHDIVPLTCNTCR